MLLAGINFRDRLWRSSKLFDTLSFWQDFDCISSCPDTLVKVSLPSAAAKIIEFAPNYAVSLAMDTKVFKERRKSSTLLRASHIQT